MYVTLVLTVTLLFVCALPVHAQCEEDDTFCSTQQLNATTTTFTAGAMTHTVDYTKSGLPGSAFDGVSMQSTFQEISDDDYAALVVGTRFEGTRCATRTFLEPILSLAS